MARFISRRGSRNQQGQGRVPCAVKVVIVAITLKEQGPSIRVDMVIRRHLGLSEGVRRPMVKKLNEGER